MSRCHISLQDFAFMPAFLWVMELPVIFHAGRGFLEWRNNQELAILFSSEFMYLPYGSRSTYTNDHLRNFLFFFCKHEASWCAGYFPLPDPDLHVLCAQGNWLVRTIAVGFFALWHLFGFTQWETWLRWEYGRRTWEKKFLFPCLSLYRITMG